jgi:hypothetical protein
MEKENWRLYASNGHARILDQLNTTNTKRFLCMLREHIPINHKEFTIYTDQHIRQIIVIQYSLDEFNADYG